MTTEGKPLINFNLDTMSGIYPGSRTRVYQRLLLHRAQSTAQWYQLQWYSEPPAALLLPQEGDEPMPAPVVTLRDPDPATLALTLYNALHQAKLRADACFACRHWQPLNLHTDDALPAGRCMWRNADASLPDALANQSALSLACLHFEPRGAPPTPESAPSTNQPRVLKSAELDPDRLPFWARLWHRLRGKTPATHWADQILERSGVGAGTEPCFVCQGRLANLGALVVASEEGDKRTLSVWRCRNCYTTYFNDWTDRWERLENLETEELYYRIAPAEAYSALSIIHTTKHGEHPKRRQERDQERAAMLALVADSKPLSHQIRQGR